MKFRLLRADEIECRISTVNEKGVSLLLYKDARVDQNILDETVGPLDWQRSHSRDNANCTVSIWDRDKEQWVSKEDTGKESYTEAEKGLASDSFKRACFNWGIGRELYTAPFIWIPAADCNIVDSRRTDKTGKQIKTCSDRFHVSVIKYDDRRNINELEIRNSQNKVVYSIGYSMKKVSEDQLEEKHINSLWLELKRTGVGIKRILREYNVSDVHELTLEQWKSVMETLKSKPDLGKVTSPPDNVEEDGLPWN